MLRNDVNILICALLCLTISIVGAAQANPLGNDDLSYHLSDNAYELMDVTYNDQTVAVPVIKYASQQALTKGVAVIISDVDAYGASQKSLFTLAQELPQWGFSTIYVAPQQAHFIAPLPVPAEPESTNDTANQADQDTSQENPAETTQTNDIDTSATEPNDEPATEAPEPIIAEQTNIKSIALQQPQLNFEFDDYLSFTSQLYAQLQSTFLVKPGYKILVVQGKSAAVSLALLANDNNTQTPQSPRFNALVLSNVYWPAPVHNHQISKHLSQVSIPVLDFTSAFDNAWSKATQDKRVIDTRINVKTLYRQRDIFGPFYSATHQQYLSKEMVGFTAYLGW